jgi:hypothetical protein
MSQVNGFGTTGGGGCLITSLTGNGGGAVGPTAGNINIVGDVTSIYVQGTPGTSTLTIGVTPLASSIIQFNTVNTSPYFAILTNFFLSVDTSAIPITIILPAIATVGRCWLVKDKTGDAVTNNITVTTAAGVILIDGLNAYIMNTAYEVSGFLWDGVGYQVF